MLNKIFLQGRLVADPELRQTPSGASVATFRIAVDRDFKNKETGEKTADFVTIVAWRNTAEFVARHFTKGRVAVVVGRLQMRNYIKQDGTKNTVAEVVAESIYFGDSKQSETPAQDAPGYGTPTEDQFSQLTGEDDSDFPF